MQQLKQSKYTYLRPTFPFLYASNSIFIVLTTAVHSPRMSNRKAGAETYRKQHYKHRPIKYSQNDCQLSQEYVYIEYSYRRESHICSPMNYIIYQNITDDLNRGNPSTYESKTIAYNTPQICCCTIFQ